MSITYIEAIRAAQQKALEDDPRVFIYGQDVGSFGAKGVTTAGGAQRSLHEKVGPDRVYPPDASRGQGLSSAVPAVHVEHRFSG